MKLYDKVYIVHTGYCTPNEGETSNYSQYKAVAPCVEEAIEQVKSKFEDGEYAESVELILVLD